MLNSNVIPESWTIREKLCLASCVMRMSENWSTVSKQMRLLSDSRRPPDFFSQKNCAQEYTNLIESLGVQKRKRSESLSSHSSNSSMGSPNFGQHGSNQNNFTLFSSPNSGSGGPGLENQAAQLVSKLTLERLEELKGIINREKSHFKKMRKEIEAIKNGEFDNQLDAIREEMEREEKNQSINFDSPIGGASGDQSINFLMKEIDNKSTDDHSAGAVLVEKLLMPDENNESSDHKNKSRDHKNVSHGHKNESRDHKNDPHDHKNEPRDHINEPRDHKNEPRDHKNEPRDHKNESSDHKNEPRGHKNEARERKSESRAYENESRDQSPIDVKPELVPAFHQSVASPVTATTPLSIAQADASSIVSPSHSPPLAIHGELSPAKSLSRSPPIKFENLSLNRPEVFSVSSPLGPAPSTPVPSKSVQSAVAVQSPPIDKFHSDQSPVAAGGAASTAASAAPPIGIWLPLQPRSVASASVASPVSADHVTPLKLIHQLEAPIAAPLASASSSATNQKLSSPKFTNVFHFPASVTEKIAAQETSTNQQKVVDHVTKSAEAVHPVPHASSQGQPQTQAAAVTHQISVSGRRQKRDSGGSTASSDASVNTGGTGPGGLGSGGTPSIASSSRSPHPIPPHFPDFDSYRVWKRTILNVYNVAAGHKHANLFYKPVHDEQAPFYSKLIRRPMCLNEIKRNVEAQILTTTAEFKRDLLMVFANAVMYNPRSHDVHQMALQMAGDTLPLIDELLGSTLSSLGPPTSAGGQPIGHLFSSVPSLSQSTTSSSSGHVTSQSIASNASDQSATTQATPGGHTSRSLRAHRSSIFGNFPGSQKRDTVEKIHLSRKRENSVTSGNSESMATPKLKKFN